MKNQIENKEKISFCVRVPADWKRTFKLASLLAELRVEGTVGDAMRFYAGSNDKKLLLRRRLFLEAFKMVAERKKLLNPEIRENPAEPSSPMEGGDMLGT